MPARCVPIEDACKYVGCKNVDQFRREVRLGKWPGPIEIKSRPLRWDIRALDAALDKMSGVAEQSDELEALKAIDGYGGRAA